MAAGASSRLGRPKQLLALNGQTLLGRTVRAAAEAGCAPVIVVVGAHADAVIGEARALPGPVQVVVNERWQNGMGTSLAAGVGALQTAAPNVRAAVVLLCDQPRVSAETVRALVDTYAASGRLIAASEYSGTLGAPCLFDQTFFGELTALSGDAGARRILARHPEQVAAVPFAGGADDVDTPNDWARVAAAQSPAGEP